MFYIQKNLYSFFHRVAHLTLEEQIEEFEIMANMYKYLIQGGEE